MSIPTRANRDDQDALARQLATLERILAAPYREYRDPEGRRRARVGLQEDGTYGLRVWDAAGTLVQDVTG